MKIPFNKPYQTKNELSYIQQSIESGMLSGNNAFFKKIESYVKSKHMIENIFLTPSGTAALEMGAWLADLKPGDEVILPSFTFTSTANAILLTGAKPIFCEVYPDTMNVNVEQMESLITKKTKMLLPIDFAGIPCEIDRIESIAKKHNLLLFVDAAQSYGSYFKGKPCGTFGDISTFSFHETKNISCGEGGALIVNRPDWIERAYFLQEKGTDRRKVLYGLKQKYHWVDIGSSYLLSDILAALLLAQLEEEDLIFALRKKTTDAYFNLLKPYQDKGLVTITPYDKYKNVNSHAFWVIFDTLAHKEDFIIKLGQRSVTAYIAYMPLHSAPMGMSLGNKPEDLPVTYKCASQMVRLPLYANLADTDLDYCLEAIQCTLKDIFNE